MAGCANFRLPAIDPSGERIFLPNPNYTTVAPERGLGLAGLAGTTPAWQSPPQPELCNTPGATGGVPYSIYTPPPVVAPSLPATAPGSILDPYQSPPPTSFPAIPVVPNPLAAPPQPAVASGLTELTGQTSLNPRDGIPGRFSINPARLVAPVGQEVILRASICGTDGLMMLNEPIEWSLSPNSVGTILEVDQNNKPLWRQLFRRPPYKVNGSYAMGLTSSARQMIPRGMPGPYDDLTLERGQTWISVTSSSEGATHVTGRANRVAGWEDRRASATIHWIDGQWRFPNPQVSGVSSPARLCTQVARATSGAPIAGWKVQYRIAGGATAAFADGSQATEVVSDSAGEACVQLAPAEGGASGVTYVQSRIIRPGQGSSDISDLVIGEGTTTVTWSPNGPTSQPEPDYQPPFTESDPNVPPAPTDSGPFDPPSNPPANPGPDPGNSGPTIPNRAPQLEVRAFGPDEARVGDQVVYEFVIRNPDSTVASDVEITNEVPRGLTYVSSSPEAAVYGSQLLWRLNELGPNQERRVTARYVVESPDTIRNCAIVGWQGAQPIDDCKETIVAFNPLQIEIRSDRSARIGQNARVDIYVRNIGNQRIEDLTLQDDYDDGLYHREASPMQIPDPFSLGPGEEKEFKIDFQVRGAGRQCHTVTLRRGDEVLARQADCINAAGGGPAPGPDSGLIIPPGNSGVGSGRPGVTINTIGKTELSVGQTADLEIRFSNTGNIPLSNVRVEAEFDPRLVATLTDPPIPNEGVSGNVIAWPSLRFLAAGQTETYRVRVEARAPTPRACLTAIVNTRERVSDTYDHCVRISGAGLNPGGDLRGRQQPDGWSPFGTGSVTSGERVVARPDFTDSDAQELAPEGLEVSIESLGTGGLDQDRLTYFVQVTNRGDEPEKNVVLMVETPEGTEFATSLNPPMIRAKRASSDKRTVEFSPIATLRVEETAKFRVVVEADAANVGRFRAKVTSEDLPEGAVFSDRAGE